MTTRDVFASVRSGGWVPYYDARYDPVRGLVGDHQLAFDLFEVVAWGLTIVFALADLVTTAVGLPNPNLAEAVPTSLWLVRTVGWPALAVEHVVVLAVLAAMWSMLPRPYRLVVPLEGALAGYVVTHTNLVTLLTHGVVLSL